MCGRVVQVSQRVGKLKKRSPKHERLRGIYKHQVVNGICGTLETWENMHRDIWHQKGCATFLGACSCPKLGFGSTLVPMCGPGLQGTYPRRVDRPSLQRMNPQRLIQEKIFSRALLHFLGKFRKNFSRKLCYNIIKIIYNYKNVTLVFV